MMPCDEARQRRPTGRRLALLYLSFGVAPLAWSHPGPGIVVDRKGEVYFVHPVHHRIMKVDADGKLTIFFQGENGHRLGPASLVLDAQENLYSVGDRDGVIWTITPEGKASRVYPTADGEGVGFIGRLGNPFIRDPEGRIYAVHSRFDQYTQILEISPNGRLDILAGGDNHLRHH